MRALTAIGAVAVALAAGCTAEHQVFGDDDAPITTCERVWLVGENGDACDLAEPCARESPFDPMCCTDFAYCRMGALVVDTTCNPDCASCADDHACAPGAAVCNGQFCEPCPMDPSGLACPNDCPPGWVFLTRNGCMTCECGPPSQCDPFLPDGSQCAPGDPNTSQCYQGQRYADPRCAPDDPGCFSNVCSTPGCVESAPVGCFTECDQTNPGCNTCATNACACDPATGTWTCEQICIDLYPQALTCLF